MFRSTLFQLKRPYQFSGFNILNIRPWFVCACSPRISPNLRLISNPTYSNKHKLHQFELKRDASGSLPVRLVNSAPLSFRPYLLLMRLDKPIGTWLLLLPTLWSAAMAIPFALHSSTPHTLLTDASASLGLTSLGFDPFVCLALTVGAIAMRGAGCTVNDYFDRDIDARVERTRNRPLASRQITSFATLVLLGGQLSVALSALLTLNWYTVILAPLSLPVVFSYPLFKRVTYWPQIVLGFAFNYGALVGFSSIAGHCDWSVCLPLYAAGMAWTLLYDTIYAHQDREDDALVGVKSTALRFPTQRSTRRALTVFATAMVSCLSLTAYTGGLHWPFYAAIAGTALHLGWQIRTLDINNVGSCLQRFKSNRNLGLLLLLGIIGSNLIDSS